MAALDHRLLMAGRTRLEGAPRGQKGIVAASLGREWGMSPSRVYAHVAQVGYTSGRKKRSDYGSSALISHNELVEMAEYLFVSQRKTGHILTDVKKGVRLLGTSGLISPKAAKASVSTWNRLLTKAGLSKRHLYAPSLATELDAEHPNHVHVVDASQGLMIYLNKGKMKIERVNLMDPKSKPEAWIKHVSRKLLIRWVLVDYYSGAIVVDYRETSGEKGSELVDFLHYCWSPKESAQNPMFGVPRVLYADQGPAQKSSLVETLCHQKKLDVELILHQSSHKRHDAPASRATGAVEGMMRVWQEEFESQWVYDTPTGGIEQVQAQARDFCIRFNSSREYLVRGTQLTRSQLWMDIKEEQLRVPPASLEAFRNLAIGRPLERTVDPYGRIRLDGKIWKIQSCDTWIRGEKVMVHRDAWDTDRLRIVHPLSGEEREAIYTPKKRNGKTVAAAIIGQKAKDRPVELPSARQPLHAAAELRKDVGPRSDKKIVGKSAKYKGSLGRHADHESLDNVSFMPRKGRPAVAVAPRRRLRLLDVQKMAVSRLNRPLTLEESTWLSSKVSGRLNEAEAVELLEELAQMVGENRQILSFGGAK